MDNKQWVIIIFLIIGTVAQWLERRSYKAVVEGSIPSSPTLTMKEIYIMNTDEQVQQIDIHIEAVEIAIEKAMTVVEKEDLVKSVMDLQQQRKKLIHRQDKH